MQFVCLNQFEVKFYLWYVFKVSGYGISEVLEFKVVNRSICIIVFFVEVKVVGGIDVISDGDFQILDV